MADQTVRVAVDQQNMTLRYLYTMQKSVKISNYPSQTNYSAMYVKYIKICSVVNVNARRLGNISFEFPLAS